MAPNSTAPGWITNIPYATNNSLQTYDVFECAPSTEAPSTKESWWIVYIHGGFFRDPLVNSTSLQAAVSLLVSDEYIRMRIQGYASLNYRLSPHSRHPGLSEQSPSHQRVAVWPQHLLDVLAGLRELQSKYGFGSNYILAGHSVGATMAILAALQAKEHGVIAPKVILGISGIYNFPLLHKWHPEYEALTFNAMQKGEDIAASPTSYSAQDFHDCGIEKVVLAHSRDVGLVPWNQVTSMETVLMDQHPTYVRVVEIFGKHNVIWANGEALATALKESVPN
jgi:acetyl esterase/lipase